MSLKTLSYYNKFVVVEKLILEGTLITKVAWGNVAYSDDKLADFDVTLQSDRCILVY